MKTILLRIAAGCHAQEVHRAHINDSMDHVVGTNSTPIAICSILVAYRCLRLCGILNASFCSRLMPELQTTTSPDTGLFHVADVDDIPPASGRVYPVNGNDVAVFHVAGQFVAVENECPHRGASLGTGTVEDSLVTCPLHAWQFDVTSGICIDRPGQALRTYPVVLQGHRIMLDVASIERQSRNYNCDGIERYLVRYGVLGWVAYFGTIEQFDCDRNDSVVIETDRGTEIGEILAKPAIAGSNAETNAPTGELLRKATTGDLQRHRHLQDEARHVFEEYRRLISERNVSAEIIEYEMLFDEQTIVLYYLGEASVEFGPITQQCRHVHELNLVFQAVIEPALTGGCGQGGCGSGCHQEPHST